MKRVKAYWSGLGAGQKKILKIAGGAAAGAALGYTYYALVGCSSGTCPITSNPAISTIWGAVIGGLISA